MKINTFIKKILTPESIESCNMHQTVSQMGPVWYFLNICKIKEVQGSFWQCNRCGTPPVREWTWVVGISGLSPAQLTPEPCTSGSEPWPVAPNHPPKAPNLVPVAPTRCLWLVWNDCVSWYLLFDGTSLLNKSNINKNPFVFISRTFYRIFSCINVKYLLRHHFITLENVKIYNFRHKPTLDWVTFSG